MFIVAVLWWYRKTVKYPGVGPGQPLVSIVTPLTDLTKNGYYEASPVRGKAIAVEGTVIGRGTPGYYFSEDLVIQDSSGILRIDYEPIFSVLAWFFALFRVPELMSQKVKVIGWYHRSPTPSVKVSRIYSPYRVFSNHWAGLNVFIVVLFLVLAIWLLVAGLQS
jgi:hypothetical protein